MSPAQKKTKTIKSIKKDRNYILLGSLLFITVVVAVVFSVSTKNLLGTNGGLFGKFGKPKAPSCGDTSVTGYLPKNGSPEQRIEAALNNILEKLPVHQFVGQQTTQTFINELEEKYELDSSFIKDSLSVKSVETKNDTVFLDLYLTPGFSLFNREPDKNAACHNQKVKTATINTLKTLPGVTKVMITVEGEEFPCYLEKGTRCREKLFELGSPDTYTQTAREGDTTTNLARRAVGMYLVQRSVVNVASLKLSTNEITYLNTFLADAFGDELLAAGTIKEFPKQKIAESVAQARNLAQTHNLEMNLTGTALPRVDTIHSGNYDENPQYKKPEEKWRFSMDSGFLERCFVLNDSVILTSGYDTKFNSKTKYFRHLLGLDVETGERVFSSELNHNGIKGCPISKDDFVYYISGDSFLSATNLVTGDVDWEFKIDYPKYDISPVLDNDMIFVASRKFLYALDLEGNAIWEYGTGGNIKGELYVDEGLVVFNNDDGYFYALTAETGEEVWKSTTKIAVDNEIDAGADVVEKNILVLRTNGSIVAVNPDSGKKYWEYEACETVGIPAVDDERVYTACSVTTKPNGNTTGFGGLVVIDKFSGEEVWKHETGYFESGSPIIAGDYVYFRTRLGDIFALRTTTGKQMWSINTGDNSSSNLILKDGVLFFVGDRFLFGFE